MKLPRATMKVSPDRCQLSTISATGPVHAIDRGVVSSVRPDREATMSSKRLVSLFSTLAVILVLWGVVFAFFGLGILPVDRRVLLSWESAIYGAIMIGWGTTLLLVGRIALRRNDAELAKSLLLGIAVWLLIEAAFSVRFGVWFNVAVDFGVLGLFSVPLVATLRAPRNAGSA
jgi:hypothetical protein